MASEMQDLGGRREIHHGGTEVTEMAMIPLTNMALAFILCARCVSVVRNPARAGDLIMQNKANFRGHQIDAKCSTNKGIRGKYGAWASVETKPNRANCPAGWRVDTAHPTERCQTKPIWRLGSVPSKSRRREFGVCPRRASVPARLRLPRCARNDIVVRGRTSYEETPYGVTTSRDSSCLWAGLLYPLLRWQDGVVWRSGLRV
jgi:hypothetical protein